MEECLVPKRNDEQIVDSWYLPKIHFVAIKIQTRARAREKSWLKPNSWDFSKWMWRENNQVIPVIRNKLLEIVDIVINRLNDLFNMRHWIGHSSYFTHFNVWIWFVSALFVMQFDFLSSSFFFCWLNWQYRPSCEFNSMFVWSICTKNIHGFVCSGRNGG